MKEMYDFADFTIKHYEELLCEAKKRNQFCFYSEVENLDDFILWRHDVDFSINRALRLAQIEHKNGIKSTFFIHLHSEYYNVLEKEITDKIIEISLLGHDIGIHFDTHFYGITDENGLEDKLIFEANLFRKVFGFEVTAFSFHNTTPFTMGCQNFTYANLINTYASFFQKGVEYCSDSNGYWRYNRMMEVIKGNVSGKMQILTHPEWWQEEVMSPWQKIQRAIDGRAIKNKSFYQEHLRKFNMKNIDWDGEVE